MAWSSDNFSNFSPNVFVTKHTIKQIVIHKRNYFNVLALICLNRSYTTFFNVVNVDLFWKPFFIVVKCEISTIWTCCEFCLFEAISKCQNFRCVNVYTINFVITFKYKSVVFENAEFTDVVIQTLESSKYRYEQVFFWLVSVVAVCENADTHVTFI